MLQHYMPAISGLYDARILILPLVFLCASVTVDFATMLFLAFMCGFFWDAQHTLAPQGGDSSIYIQKVDSLRFGYSIILYGMMGLLMQGIQPLFRKGKWHISSLLAGVAIFLYLFSEFLIINFVRGDFVFPAAALYRIYLTAAITMLFSPLVFWLLFQLASLCRHQIRYEGLVSQPRYSS